MNVLAANDFTYLIAGLPLLAVIIGNLIGFNKAIAVFEYGIGVFISKGAKMKALQGLSDSRNQTVNGCILSLSSELEKVSIGDCSWCGAF